VRGHAARAPRARARRLRVEPPLPPRPVPIRFRKRVPTTWLELELREGRNRKVRRMTAAVRPPTLRLVRVAIGALRLLELGIEPGECRSLRPEEERRLRAPARAPGPALGRSRTRSAP